MSSKLQKYISEKNITSANISKWSNDDLLDLEEPERSHLHSFLVDLDFYDRAVYHKNRDMSIDSIFERSIKHGPSFARWLDGLKAYLLHKMTNRVNFSDDLERTYGEQFPKCRAKCIGDIYRSNFLFKWTPPNPDIESITQSPPTAMNLYLNKFTDKLEIYLSQERMNFFKSDNDEYAGHRDNTKMCQEGPNWTTPLCKMAERRGCSRITFVPRELKESRAAAVEQSSSAARIRLIDSEVRRILSMDNRSKMESHQSTVQKELTDAIRGRTRYAGGYKRPTFDKSNVRWSYCRDFQKEGLTKNRQLLTIMLHCLHKRFPDAKAFDSPDFFNEWEYELNGRKIQALRGHGLGMANSLTTLMQIIIEEINKDLMELTPVYSGYVNDDAALVFYNKTEAETYASHDKMTCAGLGLTFKEKSTFLAPSHVVLCEVYAGPYHTINDKTTFSYMTLGILKKCINSAHARDMCLSMNFNNVPQYLIEDTVGYWPPLLFSGESKHPRCAGGWFRHIRNGVDISFLNIGGGVHLDQMCESAAYVFSHFGKRETYPWRRGVNHPTKKSSYLPTEWLEERNEKISFTKEDIFRPESNVKENVRSWISFEKNLKREFSRACSWWARNKQHRLTWSQLYKRECDARPKEDIFPPLAEYSKTSSFEAGITDDIDFFHPYGTSRREVDLHSYKWNLIKTSYPRKMGITGKIQSGNINLPDYKPGPAARAIALRHIYGVNQVPLNIWNVYLIPNEKTFDYWHDPFAVGRISDEYHGDYSAIIPDYLSEEKEKLLRERDSYYGTKLTWQEWMKIGSIKRTDQICVWALQDIWSTSEYPYRDEDLDSVIQFLKQYPGIGDYFDQCQHWGRSVTRERFFEKWAVASSRFQKHKMEAGIKQAQIRKLEFEKITSLCDKHIERSVLEDHYNDTRDLWDEGNVVPDSDLPDELYFSEDDMFTLCNESCTREENQPLENLFLEAEELELSDDDVIEFDSEWGM